MVVVVVADEGDGDLLGVLVEASPDGGGGGGVAHHRLEEVRGLAGREGSYVLRGLSMSRHDKVDGDEHLGGVRDIDGSDEIAVVYFPFLCLFFQVIHDLWVQLLGHLLAAVSYVAVGCVNFDGFLLRRQEHIYRGTLLFHHKLKTPCSHNCAKLILNI